MVAHRPSSGWRCRSVIAAAEVHLVASAGTTSDATEDGRVEGDDDDDRRDDGADDDERHVEDDVDVVHLRVDVAVRQLAARATAAGHDADGEGRESGEDDGGDRLGDDDTAGVRHRDDERPTKWVEDSDEPLHSERGHQPGGQQSTGVRQVTDGDARHRRRTHHLQYSTYTLHYTAITNGQRFVHTGYVALRCRAAPYCATTQRGQCEQTLNLSNTCIHYCRSPRSLSQDISACNRRIQFKLYVIFLVFRAGRISMSQFVNGALTSLTVWKNVVFRL